MYLLILTLWAKKAILIFIGRQCRRPVTQPKAAIIRSNIMTTLTVGQCLTSFNNEYVVSAVNLADGKISYTILGLNAPTCAPLLETSLRFYQVIDKTLSLDELRARRQVVQSVTDQREARHQAKEDARQLANERASADPENAGLLTTATESNTTKLAAKRGGKREPQKIPPFRIVEFFGGVVRGMTTRQRLPHLSEALWRDAETPGNSATPVPGPQ
uniref:hypothetical protein n=1 Tax=Klebsiella pneumoniae TaxID=573 RepID=UPI0029C875CB|nr:hypothetical protein [Klebsiella pneumoniae]